MTPESIVFVVDDDSDMREALRLLVESIGLSVRDYGSARRFLDEYDAAVPGCLILDVRMPEMSGLELQQAMRERGIQLPIIVVTAFGEVSSAVQAMKAGAFDFLEKPFSGQLLLDRVTKALEWDRQQRSARGHVAELAARIARLTPRERSVLDLVVSGKSNKAMAAELDLSPKTIEVHRAHVMQKLQAGSVAELVQLVVAVRGDGAPPHGREGTHPAAGGENPNLQQPTKRA